MKHRARKWEFIAYLRIQTSLTITLFDHCGYRKWFCWAEKNAEVMQPGEKTSGGMTVLVIRALTWSKKALYNISNPKTFSILLIMSHILHFKVNMFNLKFWEYYIAHLQLLIFQECKAPFQSYCFSGYNLPFYKGWPLFPILILMTLHLAAVKCMLFKGAQVNKLYKMPCKTDPSLFTTVLFFRSIQTSWAIILYFWS